MTNEDKRKGVFLWAERWPPDSKTTLTVCPPEEVGFVTRDEFERKYEWLKQGVQLACWIGFIALIGCLLLSIVARADSTFVPIEKPKLNDTLKVEMSDGTTAVYVWCRVGTIGRMDTMKSGYGLRVTSEPAPHFHSYSSGSGPGLYVDSGLDSVYILPHDTTVVRSATGLNDVKITIPGHWEYFRKMETDTTKPLRVPVRVLLSREAQIDSILAHLSFRGGRIIVNCPITVWVADSVYDGAAIEVRLDMYGVDTSIGKRTQFSGYGLAVSSEQPAPYFQSYSSGSGAGLYIKRPKIVDSLPPRKP